MTLALVLAGGALVAVALVDVAWTTVAAGSGAGPVTGWVGRSLWGLALRVHARRRSHALLSLAGVAIVFAVLASWIGLVLAGWALVFSASEGAVRASHGGSAADLPGRLYFTGYTVFTLGNGDYVPGSGVWQLATVIAVGTGLVLVTLSITYLVPVASAVSLRRQLASYIASLGSSPQEILRRGWNGSSFSALAQHLVSLTALLQTSRQQHFTYPVLHYFHSMERESSAPPNIANLSQAVHLLAYGVAPGARPDPGVLEPLDATIGSFLNTLRGAYLEEAEPVAVPDLAPLRDAGLPVLSESAYAASSEHTQTRRALLGGLLADDGWASSRAVK